MCLLMKDRITRSFNVGIVELASAEAYFKAPDIPLSSIAYNPTLSISVSYVPSH